MKKWGFFVATLLLLFSVSQLDAQQRHWLGVVGSLNLADISQEPQVGLNFSTNTLFGAGLLGDVALTDYLALRLQPMYMKKGSKLKSGNEEVGETTLDYVTVPAMLKLNIGSARTQPYLVGGPYVGFLLSANQTIEGEKQDIKENTKNLDFGLDFGAGVRLPVGNNAFFIEGRYALGLININDDPEDTTKIKNRNFQVMAGFSIPLGGE